MFVNRADLGQPHADIVNTELPLLVTAAGQYRMDGKPEMPTHRPDGRGDYQLIYIATGCGHFVLDGNEQILQKGTAILYRPNVVQNYTFYGKDDAEYYWCHFTGSEVAKLLSDCHIAEDRMVFSAGTSSDFQWLFLQMIRELQLKQSGYDTILPMNLRHILLLISRQQADEKAVGNKILGEIENAIRHFHMHFSWNIEIKEYAQQHLMSPYWFSQNFKKVTGCSPAQYLISLRMAHAMNLLDNTDDTVAQIALAVGYDNTQYFYRLFRNHTGMTPVEYKERRKQQHV